MGRERQKGSITVFLSLICMIFFALICTAVESARIQGAKAQTANILGMGNYSVLGEYEKCLLDRYELFALDGAYGSGEFSKGKAEDRLNHWLTINSNPRDGRITSLCFDPWNLELTESGISEYMLLTDSKGEPFFQQAVEYMKQNLPTEILQSLYQYQRDADRIQNWQEEYGKKKKEREDALEQAEIQKNEVIDQMEEKAEKEDTELVLPEIKSNPLEEIAKLRKRSILNIVTGNRAVSGKELSEKALPSRKRSRSGTMKIEKKNSGVLAVLLFREYLIDHFTNYTSLEKDGCMSYETEYILGGKKTDEQNLKYTVNRLLLLRETMNYMFCAEDPLMNLQAGSLAAGMTAFFGLPVLTAATKQALLLAWAYGESLVDVRNLLAGGKVPLFKSGDSWVLTLDSLGQLTRILDNDVPDRGEGIEYRDYLRILLHMGALSGQKLRALDLIQENLKQTEGLAGFRAENCITGITTEAQWRIHPVFLRVAQVTAGVRDPELQITQSGGMGYH